MKQLTLDHIKKHKLNPAQWVLFFDSTLDKEKVDFILWEETSFPMGSEKLIVEQLNTYFNKTTK